MSKLQLSALYLSHGGGPLPLLGDPLHTEMVDVLNDIARSIVKPAAIVLVSAHWEQPVFTVTSGRQPQQIYDYYGFPDESYEIQYCPPGFPELAQDIARRVSASGIPVVADARRGFDHGLFVPLKIMYPDADIPCIQISLKTTLDPASHIELGMQLSYLKDEKVLVIGSGFSFHNMKAFFSQPDDESGRMNSEFEDWLAYTCMNDELSEAERKDRLIHWVGAPHARYCHPREEHLLPLHTCYGVAGHAAIRHYSLNILNKKASMIAW
jgi:aromatic ring-opening dioxygenase catalytic subunit (LigB family)